jgi:hypothetical protein
MTDSRGVLREIAWRELFPWLTLGRAFRLAIQPIVLGVALLAAFLTPVGWRVARVVFGIPTTPLQQVERMPPTVVSNSPATEASMEDLRASLTAQELSRFPGTGRELTGDLLLPFRQPSGAFSDRSPIPFVFQQFARPVLGMYQTATTLRGFAFYLSGLLWTLAVWSFAGGLITRIAAVEIGREEQAGIRKAFRLTLRRWLDLFTAPLYPVLGTFLIAVVLTPIGWLLWSSDVGIIVAGLLWVFVLLGGAVSALLLLWLLVGWPLMWPAISAEETGDAFEAMSRSYSYSFQRPLHYLFYAVVAALFGYVCWTLVDFVCYLTLEAAHWSVSWGSGHARLREVFSPLAAEPPSASLRFGRELIAWTEGIVRAISEAFAYSFFWVSSTVIYLLLRQSVDRTEFDEVWLADETPRSPLPIGVAEASPSPNSEAVPESGATDVAAMTTPAEENHPTE